MQVGDPLEAGAVANVFGEYGIYIGSVSAIRQFSSHFLDFLSIVLFKSEG
jgi:hypothetical protein